MAKRKPNSGERVLRSLQEFLRLEAAGGLVLMTATVLALIIANSSLAGHYRALLDLPFAIKIGDFGMTLGIRTDESDILVAQMAGRPNRTILGMHKVCAPARMRLDATGL